MDQLRRQVMVGLAAAFATTLSPRPVRASDRATGATEVIDTWYRLILELVRHTPTYSPPVASRAFAYLGVMVHEAVTDTMPDLRSLGGQLNGLAALPPADPGETHDLALVLHGALALGVSTLFANTGPTGQRALKAITTRLETRASAGVAAEGVVQSQARGQAIARHILDWAQNDGGAVIDNLGFPQGYTPAASPAAWVPTSTIALQQAPLLPAWGTNRTFAMPDGASCPLPPPIAYSESPDSAFYAEAREVYDVQANLTDEQRAIAQFWSDDAMLSLTPPGHWISIALQVLQREDAPLDKRAEVLARLGIALADAFIGCWNSKFAFDLLRPVTYIRKTMDPTWNSLLITPPFPEYPSGHSTQSGAAATVLTAMFGENFAFEDTTHDSDGLGARRFPSFHAAADEAALSRLYGGIHFRAAILRGVEQGRCIGAYAVALQTRL